MKRIDLLTLLLLCASLPVLAQALRSNSMVDQQRDSLLNDHKIIFVDGKPEAMTEAYRDSIRSLIETFFYDQFTSFSDPAAPYFLFMSRDANLSMGIGGCVNVRGWYDMNAPIPGNYFAPYKIPMVKDPANNTKIGGTPAFSTLFFRVIGRNKSLGEYQLYLEANFQGNDHNDFLLKRAYAQIEKVTMGYTVSTFSDPAAVPPMVDACSPTTKIEPVNLLVRWMNTYRHRWTVAASVENPVRTAVSAVDGKFSSASQNVPDVATFLQYSWGRSEHVRLAGLLRSLTYKDIPTNTRHHKAGWGVQLSGVIHPVRPLTVYATLNCGKGYENTVNDLMNGNYDLIPDQKGDGMYAPLGTGWCLGLQYNFRPDIFASVSYSDSRYFPESPREASEYRFGNVLTANVFWNLTARIQAGIEFDTGVRRNWDGQQRRSDRLAVMAQFSF